MRMDTTTDFVRQHPHPPENKMNLRTELPESLGGAQLAAGYSARKRDGTRDKQPFFQARGVAAAAGFSSTVEDLGPFASWRFRLLEKSRLATLVLPSTDPKENLILWQHAGGDTFRRIRTDDPLGEELIFVRDKNRRMIRCQHDSNYWKRLK